MKQYDYCGDFIEGLAAVELGGKWGFINRVGKEIIPLIYDFCGNFLEGRARVKSGGKCGFIDRDGNETWEIEETETKKNCPFRHSASAFNECTEDCAWFDEEIKKCVIHKIAYKWKEE